MAMQDKFKNKNIRVEIFHSRTNEKKLQKELNQWLENNTNINIVKILQTQSGRLDREVVISIFYTK